MFCPRCKTPMSPALETTPSGRIELDYCPSCRGVWFDHGELATLLRLGNTEAFEVSSPIFDHDADHPSMPCPRHPDERMRERQLSTARAGLLLKRGGASTHPGLRLDQCPACSGVWLDGGELDELVRELQDARMQPFLLEVPKFDRPVTGWLWAFMFFTGLPVEQWQPRIRRPLIVTSLIVLCVLAYLMQVKENFEGSIYQYGFIPNIFWGGNPITLFTHMFLHGSLVHLLGNLYFLWVFGDNVEDRLGHGRFIWLYLLSGVGAAICHALLTDNPTVPCVGASGAISGVMAAYAVLFPKARLISMIFVFPVRWRTSVYLGAWLVLQMIGALMHSQGIAWWAHIGGFAVGGVIAWRWKQMKQPQLKDKELGHPLALAPPAPAKEPSKLEWR